MLLNRYKELTTQYNADLKRLNFIVDGEANLKDSFSTQCPFCDGEIVVKKNRNYIDAAKSDYKKIKLQAFKVKEHLDYNFINALNSGIKSFLENCNYDNLLSVVFDKTDMDIVINGKKKRKQKSHQKL